jgi:20S proteasome subunit beta 7
MAPGTYAPNPIEHTLSPIVTGATVIAVKYDGGVLVAADTLASYGSQARYKDFVRMRPVGSYSLLGASGEMSDFQYMGKMIDELDEEDWLSQDGCMLGPKQYASYVGRVMYNRRSKGNPLYNQFLVVGKKGDEPPLLAFVDHQGTYFEDDYCATGFGSYLAMPLLRNEWKPTISKADAEQLIIKCLKICFYRDCRAFCKYTIGCCDGTTATISDTLTLDHFWEHEAYIEKRLTGASAKGASADSW